MKKKRVYPYGPHAAKSIQGFKEVPCTHFATTLAVMYPFLAVERETWEDMRKICAYTMTRLWSQGHVRRHMHFVKECTLHLDEVFDSYEENGGDYNGLDDEEVDEDDVDEAVQVQEDTVLDDVDAVF